MFNVTVLKMKDIIKYFIGMIITILIILMISKVIGNKENKEEKVLNDMTKTVTSLTKQNLLSCVDTTIPAVEALNTKVEINKEEQKDEEKKIVTENHFFEQFLDTQISAIKTINENTNTEENIEKDKEDNSNNIEQAQTGLGTEVITQNPIAENYNAQYGKVKIKNQTEYNLTEEMLTPDVTVDNKNVIIFHTHSCESYTSSDAYPYTPTGSYRTTDLNYTVTRVGTELENQLKQYNFNVIHNTDYHDYPAYNGSYTRSLETVENILKDNPSDIIIDLHRDAIGSRSDYAPIVKIGENDVAAQIMFVIGTNDGGLWHPNWNQNLKFAIKVQEKAEEMYPGLFKPIMLTTSRYNQHTGKFANIIEVGATGNTLEQCLTSMKYFAKVMDEISK